MTDSEYAATVRQIWVQTDGLPPMDAERRLVHHGRKITRDMWMTEGDRRTFELLPAIVTVYRGCETGRERGWSWSLTHRDAERFAKDILLVGTVPKTDIFALFSAVWEEEEVIVPGGQVTITSVEQTREWNRPHGSIDEQHADESKSEPPLGSSATRPGVDHDRLLRSDPNDGGD